MRILTVRQPWAWAIIHGGKDVENRVRNIAGDYRGPVAIHVGLAFPFTRDMLAVRSIVDSWPRVTDRWDNVIDAGHIIGVVDLIEATPWTSYVDEPIAGEPGIMRRVPRQPVGWEMRDHWHLRLENPRPLSEPIPFKGALGLRRLDADTIARIEAQL